MPHIPRVIVTFCLSSPGWILGDETRDGPFKSYSTLVLDSGPDLAMETLGSHIIFMYLLSYDGGSKTTQKLQAISEISSIFVGFVFEQVTSNGPNPLRHLKEHPSSKPLFMSGPGRSRSASARPSQLAVPCQ